MFKKKSKLLALVLIITLVLSAQSPRLVAAGPTYENPPLEEIAQKIEIVAREKGIPSVILKVIAFKESSWRQFDKNGNVVIGKSESNPSLGIMQITSYDASDPELVEKLRYDIDFNIAFGADLLNEKWNMVPQIGDGDRNKLENWYFALWAYNSWSVKNNPHNAAANNTEAYQDKILRIAATEYLPGGVVTPVQITPIPPELIEPDTVPTKDQIWETPKPYTFGDLRVGSGDNPSRGGPEPTVIRIDGQDRIDTVNQIALKGWPQGAETVILTRADDFPDALTGVPLAKIYKAPILVTDSEELTAEVADTLSRLKPSQLILLGGEAALSSQVEQQVIELLPDLNALRRIAGANRYETAALIAQEFPGQSDVALATGLDFPDALSLAAAAAANDIPLLLVSTDRVPEVTSEALLDFSPEYIYLAGGEKAISVQVASELAELTGVAKDRLIRFDGADRYETSALIAELFYPRSERIYLATGTDFADPLATGALAAVHHSGLLLISPRGLEPDCRTENYLRSSCKAADVIISGSEELISEETVDRIKTLIK